MKKLYSLLTLAIVSLVAALPASATKIVVDDASHVKVTYYDASYNQVELQFVDNEATIENQKSYSVTPVTPFVLKSVIASNGNNPYYSSNGANIYNSSEDDVTYTITTFNLDEARTASCTVNVDDASLVSAYLPATSTSVSFVNGANTLKFDPESETTLAISSTNYQVPIYEVKLNGAVVSSQGGGYYQIPLTDGCVIDITAKIPAVETTVKFTYNETGEGALSYVSVNNQRVEDFDGTTLTVMTGDRVELTANPDYQVDALYINGESQYWYSSYPYSFTVLSDTEVKIEAHKYATLKVTVNVDNPEYISLYNSSYASGEPLTLTGTSTELELMENSNYLCWKANAQCYISEVIVNGEKYPYDNIQVTDGMTITFVSGQYVADQTLVVWLDNRDFNAEYFSFQSVSTRDEFALVTGYNIIEYYEAMAPFGFSYYTSAATLTPELYLDGQIISPLYEGSSFYQFQPQGSPAVFKMFMTTTPVECAVTITNTDNLAATIVRDIVVPVDETALTCFAGTQLDITPTDPIEVIVNGVAATADENGAYTLTVADPQTDIVIAKPGSSAISEITAVESADNTVYNLQGIKVGTTANLSTLPAGLYINNGRKVIVK